MVKTCGVRTEPSNMSNREKCVGIVGIGEKWRNKGKTIKIISRKRRYGECMGIQAI